MMYGKQPKHRMAEEVVKPTKTASKKKSTKKVAGKAVKKTAKKAKK